MNSVHDMGGMHGMGPLGYVADEPVFHAHWEARMFATSSAMGAWRRWNIDASRHQREQIPAPDYLRLSYYEHWYSNLTALAVKHGLITPSELASGRPDPGSARLAPPLTADKVAEGRAKGSPKLRSVAAQPRFQPGVSVRARNMHPIGHTRLPRYVRGRVGVIERHHGRMCFRTRMRISSVKRRSTSTRFGLPHVRCGARRPMRATPCISICGKATLSQPDRTAALPGLPRNATGPVFAAPWQAQVFALTVQLSNSGCFAWTEWAAALGAELRQAAERGEPDDGSRYYEHWLAALERLTTSKGLADRAALHARKAAWAEAHRATPHGQPVVLGTRVQR